MNEALQNEKEEVSLDKILKGDRKEFARFVDLYSGMIYNLAMKMLENPQDAEDVLQETFLKAFKNLHTFKGDSKIKTWLYRIAVNEALMMLRKRKPELNALEIDDQQDEEEKEQLQIVDWCCIPEAELLSDESRSFLDEAVKGLSPALRAVFLLRDVEGFSVRETADLLQISDEAVKTRLFRARLDLRQKLTHYYGGYMK